MIQNKKIVVVTPAGRKKYMEVLLKYILREKDIIDEYKIWVNTTNKSDIAYFKQLEKEYKGFITLDERFLEERETGENRNIYRFFDKCIDSDTIYIRLDDDIVYLQPDFIKLLATYRINNPDPFLVYGTILNNGVIDSIVQNLGLYSSFPYFNYSCTDTIAFDDSHICENKHSYLLHNYLLKLKTPPKLFEKWVLQRYERVSINCISWLGETFATFNGEVGEDEEAWLSMTHPEKTKNPNVVFGGAYCVHFAFGPQRDYLDKTNILSLYKQVAQYLDLSADNIDLSKVNWGKVSSDSKLLIYKILMDNKEDSL